MYSRLCSNDDGPPSSPIELNPVIECGIGSEALRVRLAQPFSEMPIEGKVPAKFENLALPLHDYVNVSTHPVFHTRLLQFSNAYCEYRINVDSREGRYYVLNSSLECEGTSKEIRCELR